MGIQGIRIACKRLQSKQSKEKKKWGIVMESRKQYKHQKNAPSLTKSQTKKHHGIASEVVDVESYSRTGERWFQ